MSLLLLLKKDVIGIIAPIINKLDTSQSFEFLNMDDLCVFIACIAQYSYLARAPDVSTRWINLKINEEFDENDEDEDETVRDEIMVSQVDFELKSNVMPIFGELEKREIKVDHIRKLSTNINFQQIALSHRWLVKRFMLSSTSEIKNLILIEKY